MAGVGRRSTVHVQQRRHAADEAKLACTSSFFNLLRSVNGDEIILFLCGALEVPHLAFYTN